jgi:glycosyltransferase involved in cell wall biosynthesis
MKLNIAIVVHGRFHSFDLARELINQGHDVTLFTNYPKKIVDKFGIPKKYVRSFLLHGILSRVAHQLHQISGTSTFEASIFSKSVTNNLIKYNFDIIHAFSGVAEEIFQLPLEKNTLKIIVRGSSHINTQSQLLLEEEKRANRTVDKPSNWMIAREKREYQLADKIIVLSTFAKKSFIERSTQIEKFRPDKQVIECRYQRILSNQPLNVLMVGTFSYRKGAIDLVKIAELGSEYLKFKFVGSVTKEASNLAQKSSNNIEFVPKQPQFELPKLYADADVFIFTTIEDGYAVVLSQAQAMGLPIIATTNCSASDIIVEGETGWILPIRSPESFVERLQWCHENRQELAQMVRKVYQDFIPRDWAEVATDFAAICTDLLKEKAK